jgi:hypothetical protein
MLSRVVEGRRRAQVIFECPKIELGLPPLLEALMKIFYKYNHTFTSLVYLWLTYVYAHVGMLVCTRIMLVCTRGPLQGVGSTRMHSSIFFEAGNCEGYKKVHSWENNVSYLILYFKIKCTKMYAVSEAYFYTEFHPAPPLAIISL